MTFTHDNIIIHISLYAALIATEPEPPRRSTPLKHMVPHVVGRLCADGSLVRVLPHSPADGQPATVELAHMNELLQQQDEAEQLRAFPGPLVRWV